MPRLLVALPAVHGDTRQHMRRVLDNELVVFSLVMIAANFPLHWLLPKAYVRYFLPAGPFVAIVIAAIIDLYLSERPEMLAYTIKIIRVVAALVLPAVPVIAGVALSKGIQLSLHLGLLLIAILLSAGVYLFRPLTIRVKKIPVLIALWVGLFSILFADINIQKTITRGESPKQADQAIERLLPAGTPKVYEIGTRRTLTVTCDLKHEIIESHEFGQLIDVNPDEGMYLLFDTDLLKNLNDRQEAFCHSMQ